MMAGGHEPPKYAHFETGPNGHAVEPKKVSDDALPPMPSWDTAAKKRILTEEEQGAVELGELDPKTGQNVPLMTGAGGPISRTGSPVISPAMSPYGDRPGMNDQHSYMAGANGAAAMGVGAMGAGAMAMGGRGAGMDPYGRGGPNDRGAFHGGPGQAFSPVSGPGRGGPGPYENQFPLGPGNGGNFGPPAAAAGGAYGRPTPQRFHSNDSNRPLMGPGPSRPYPDSGPAPLAFPTEPSASPYGAAHRGPGRKASPPIDSNQGFDFDGRGPPPQQHGMAYGGNEYGSNGRRNSPPSHSQYGGGYAGSTAPPSYASRSPPPQSFASRSPPPHQQSGGGGGYQPYAPPPPHNDRDDYAQGRGALGRPPNSAGRGREAHGWEGV